MTRFFITVLLFLFASIVAHSQVLTIDANGHIVINCSNMPEDAITKKTKGNAATGYLGDGLSSHKSSTVYYKIQIASADCPIQYNTSTNTASTTITMSWCAAVGYTATHTGSYPEDTYLNIPSGTLTSVSPNSVFMYGAPIVNDTNIKYGCNGYYEGDPADAETGVGCWRLPNKRELLLMWIYKEQLNHIKGFNSFTDNIYWSSSERYNSSSSDKGKTLAHFVNFNSGLFANIDKTTSYRARCVRELP